MPYRMEQTHHRANGVVVFYEHVNDEPAMILGRQVMGEGRSFIIGLSSAHNYTDDYYLMDQARKAAEVLGLGTDKPTVVNLADAILDYLGDLVRMPPPGPQPQDAAESEAIRESLTVGG
ncbi:hypothetical protein [Thiohalorhabdus sp.]|uniref:hypothetical protein n=1 Tax=Thiohalorhabdus sp. TaxID=3094134 RepID=UPI002FC3821C